MAYSYLNIHVLRPIAAANPNRDDQGAPKTIVYGGTTRGRLSSASLNRAARVGFEEASPADRTVRSAHTAQRIAERVAGNDSPDEKLVAYIAKQVGALTTNSEDAKDTLVWLEAAKVDSLIAEAAAKFADEGDLTIADLDRTTALSVAMFGRMFAAQPDLQMEAALATAHAITTHSALTEIDYFTAVDDDPTAAQGAGAGHIGLKMLTSGVYYSYMALERAELHRNWLNIGATDAPERLALFWRHLLSATPTGMNSKAPVASLPALVVAIESSQPGSLAAAFEKPVAERAGSGWMEPSIDRLASWVDTAVGFGGESMFGKVWWATTVPGLDLKSEVLGAASRVPTFDGLTSDLATWAATS
jgi:CRISPR system Cascade subunit CasC